MDEILRTEYGTGEWTIYKPVYFDWWDDSDTHLTYNVHGCDL